MSAFAILYDLQRGTESTSLSSTPTSSSVTTGSSNSSTCGSNCSGLTRLSIGYIGCSITQISVSGYNNVTDGGLFWNPAYPTGGGIINDWTNTSSPYWANFDRELGSFGQPRVVWMQVCVANPSPANFSMVVSAVQILRSKVPNATIFISPLATYGPGASCTFGNVTGSYSLASKAVADGLGHQGPFLGPWTAAEMGGADCDPHTTAALELVGTQLARFFG